MHQDQRNGKCNNCNGRQVNSWRLKRQLRDPSRQNPKGKDREADGSECGYRRSTDRGTSIKWDLTMIPPPGGAEL